MKPTTLLAIIGVLLIPVVALAISIPNRKPPMEPTPAPTTTPIADASSATKVKLITTKGDIVINLYKSDAPKAVENFVTLGKRGYFNQTFFHRIIESFVIQGGDPGGTGTGGESIYGAKFANEESGRPFVKGSLGMANAGKDTNSSQFFIVTQAAQPNLDGGYTNFGEIDPASQSVVDAIAAVPVDDPNSGRPVDPSSVKITGFEVIAE
jgi:cyclophilin family peptidyl-prolyl cis-trans isomerase